MSGENLTSVSTHILDTSLGRPAAGVDVRMSARNNRAAGDGAAWSPHGTSVTDADGRCKDFPALPEGTTHVRLVFETEAYFSQNKRAEAQQDAPALRDSDAFFPEVAITFAVDPGEHYHVPLLLTPFGYSVYRGS
ncbi:hydroxyisourate hydrolase [Streptomyces iconiensis]|uniref:5-hydroxyisourate hydrolase n=1 Tax=Streptomyces iconiensis TaxID=1384038 RepID=A0ABT6ZUX2_9ACTN|nr:hydroxyisourate hydrolase [Streptomyces iconiensis]MDJ1132871.1 hydroxyisourate hydrolase [Streptomyces iconiensis]